MRTTRDVGVARTALRLGRVAVAPVVRWERQQEVPRTSTTADHPRASGYTSA
jgi:hypothetical protein